MNRKTVIGAGLLALLLLISVLGPQLAPYDKNHSVTIREVQTPEGPELVFAPEEPGPEHPFGTDIWGYDVLSLMLYGARYTILGCIGIAAVRLILGSLIGLYMGLTMNRPVGSANLNALNGVPAFVILFFILFPISINSPLPVWQLFLIQGGLIAILGIPQVASTVQARTYQLKHDSFVEAARSVGAGRARILFVHILPHLRESLIILGVHEAIATLNTIGQLGIFNVFLGGTLMTPYPVLYHSITHEWAGLIGQVRLKFHSAQWMLLWPLAGYLVLLLSFHLLSRGLDAYFARKYARYPHL